MLLLRPLSRRLFGGVPGGRPPPVPARGAKTRSPPAAPGATSPRVVPEPRCRGCSLQWALGGRARPRAEGAGQSKETLRPASSSASERAPTAAAPGLGGPAWRPGGSSAQAPLGSGGGRAGVAQGWLQARQLHSSRPPPRSCQRESRTGSTGAAAGGGERIGRPACARSRQVQVHTIEERRPRGARVRAPGGEGLTRAGGRLAAGPHSHRGPQAEAAAGKTRAGQHPHGSGKGTRLGSALAAGDLNAGPSGPARFRSVRATLGCGERLQRLPRGRGGPTPAWVFAQSGLPQAALQAHKGGRAGCRVAREALLQLPALGQYLPGESGGQEGRPSGGEVPQPTPAAVRQETPTRPPAPGAGVGQPEVRESRVPAFHALKSRPQRHSITCANSNLV